MAKNRRRAASSPLTAVATECLHAGAGISSGDPLMWGQIPGVALTDEDLTADQVTFQADGVWELSVKGESDAGANEAVAGGDVIYMDADGELNKDEVNGRRFGYALQPVNAGATSAILVRVGY